MNYTAAFWVPGVPQQKGSKVPGLFYRNGKPIPTMRDANEDYRPWEQAIRAAALEHKPPKPLAGAFCCDALFFFEKPKTVEKGLLHTDFPDRDKLLRCVQDALSKFIWIDDKQVCMGLTGKFYLDAPTPGALIRVEAMGDVTIQQDLFEVM